MKTEMRLVRVAFDGKPFFDPEDCEKYEEASFPSRFVGLTLEQVVDAFERREGELAEAFRKAGARVRAPRRVRQIDDGMANLRDADAETEAILAQEDRDLASVSEDPGHALVSFEERDGVE